MLLRHLHRRIGVSSLPFNGSPGAKVQTIPISASRVSILHTRSISFSSHRDGYPSSTNVRISAPTSSSTYSRPAISTGHHQSLTHRRHYAQEALKSQVEEDEPQVSPESSPLQTWKHYAPRVYAKTTKAPSSRIVERSMIPDSKPVTGKLEKVEGQEVRDDDKALQKNGKGVAAGDRNRVRSTDHHGTSTDARSTVNKSSVSNPRSTEKLVPEATNRRSRSTSNPAALRNRGSSDGHPHLDDIHEMEQLAFDPQDHQVRRGRSRNVENDRQARMEDKKAPRDFGDGIGDAAAWRGKGGSADRDPVKKTRLTVKKPASVSSRGNLLPDNRSPNSVSRNPTKSARRGRSVQDMRAVPGNIDADDIGEVEDISHEHVQLGLGLALTTSPSDAYIDAPTDHPLGDDFDEINQADLMRHLQGVEEYAPEQNESLKKGLKDVRGRSAWGTKENPLKGDLDPLEVDVMGIDKLAGGEEQLSLFTDQELEALMSAARERGEHVVESDGADLPRTSKRARFKSRSATMETASLPLSVKAARFPPSALLDENSGARYGMDGNGNPTPSRFQWWERATSRHAASLYHAKKVMVRRRSLPVQRMTSKDYWFRPLKSYTDNFVPLIEAEQAHEERLIRERLDSNGAEKLVMEGYCLNELSARRDAGTQAGRPTYTFSFAGHGTRRFAWNRFNPGTCVIISPSGERANPVKKNQSKGGTGSNTYNTGSVVSKTHGSVKVSFDEPLNAAGLAQTWRLDIWTSDIVMRRAKEALATLHYDPVEIDQYGVYKPPKRGPPTEEQAEAVSNQELEEKPAPKPTVNQLILPGTALRRVLLDDFILHDPSVPRPARLDGPGFFADNELIQTWCRRQLVEGREPIEVEGDPEMTLNTSQRRAIATMLSSNMSLIQGPPGTGKTRTIIEMLRLLKVHWEVPQPILVSAYTNNAVDNLAEGMSKRGLKVLRYGSRSRIRNDLERLTLDWYLEQHPDKDELRRLKGLTYNLAKDDPRREGYRSRLFGLERRMVTDILLGVDVVCATCISSRGRLLEVVDFPVVFIDEASMATEPNAVIPLTKGCQHAALIGDHKQLPPLVISAKAAEGKLQTSLFERLINSGKIPSVMLDTQYRMHPSISAFPSKAFYGSKLKDGTIDKEGKVLPGLEPPQGLVFKNDVTGQQRTVTFIHHTKPDFARAKSIVNEGEAKIVYKVVLQLLKENPQLMGSDIGIIAPYAGQISRIENEIRHNTRRRLQSLEYLGEERSWELDRIEVHTVDGFEGREKRVILFSTTRSNEGNWIGFLDDWRRMNVGLTRAKSGLIIVGNSHTLENARSNLTTDPEATAGTVYWRQLIRDLREANAIESYDIENVVSTSLGKDDAAVEIDMQEVEEREQEAGSVREKM